MNLIEQADLQSDGKADSQNHHIAHFLYCRTDLSRVQKLLHAVSLIRAIRQLANL